MRNVATRRKTEAVVPSYRHMRLGTVGTSAKSEGSLGRIGCSGLGCTILGWRTLGCSEADIEAGFQVRAVVMDQWIEIEELR